MALFLGAVDSGLLLIVHFQTSFRAEVRVSSGMVRTPSKINLFLAFQIVHNIQENREQEVIPAGGRHRCEQRSGQDSIKSTIPV